MENHAENVHKKSVPDPFLILVKKTGLQLHAQKSFKKKMF